MRGEVLTGICHGDLIKKLRSVSPELPSKNLTAYFSLIFKSLSSK